jgi:hypothetical protein
MISYSDLADLPPVLDLPTAGRLIGLGRTASYQAVREGSWPTPVLRVRRKYAIPTAPLLELLGLVPNGQPDAGHGQLSTDPQLSIALAATAADRGGTEPTDHGGRS